MAVINREAGNCDNGRYLGRVVNVPSNFTCELIDVSCRFLDSFNRDIAENVALETETNYIIIYTLCADKTLIDFILFHAHMQKFYSDEAKANAAVKQGEVVGVMFFDRNFSTALREIRDDPTDASPEQILASEIAVTLDMGSKRSVSSSLDFRLFFHSLMSRPVLMIIHFSIYFFNSTFIADRQMGLYLEKKLSQRFFEIYSDIMEECGLPRNIGDPPLRVRTE